MLAILLIDHGSRRQAANETLAAVAALVQAQAPVEATVFVAHMELAEPTIEQAIGQCLAAGTKEVVVMPYMLAPGRHATEDIPRMVEEALRRLGADDMPVRVTAPLAVDPLLATLVLKRCGLT